MVPGFSIWLGVSLDANIPADESCFPRFGINPGLGGGGGGGGAVDAAITFPIVTNYFSLIQNQPDCVDRQ